jgi:hypothetical protein
MRGKILLLAVAGLTLLLGGFANAALSFPLSSATTGASTFVNVIAPSSDPPDVNLKNHIGTIPADNAFHSVDDIKVSEYDSTYSYELTRLQITFNGFTSGSCGSHTYQIWNSVGNFGTQDETNVNFVFDGLLVDTLRDLQLSINPSGTVGGPGGCLVTAGIVTATFQIAGGEEEPTE